MGCGASSQSEKEEGKGKAPSKKDHPIFNSWSTKHRPLILGHRGGSLKYQENTLAAFKHMYECGVDGVEMDVRLSPDGVVYVFHDEDAERLTGTKLDTRTAPWTEVSELRIKKKLEYDTITLEFEQEEKIPTLEEVFQEFKGKAFVMNVELKPPEPSLRERKTGTEVAKLIREHGMEKQVICTGFDFLKLRALEKEYPGLESGWQYDDNMSSFLGEANIWFEDEKDIEPCRFNANEVNFVRWIMEAAAVDNAVGASVVGLEHVCVDGDTIEKFHEKGFAVGCFTFFPIDYSAIKRRPESEEQADRESRNVLKQLFKRHVDWVETDDGLKTLEYFKTLVEEVKKEERSE